MKTLITACLLSLGLLAGTAHAADAAATCEKSADEKKLAGAARTSFVKKCTADAGGGGSASCDKAADDKKLAGAARTSFVKKCNADAGGGGATAAAADPKATCEKSADDKKLAGAARNSHIKKCMADEQAAAPKK